MTLLFAAPPIPRLKNHSVGIFRRDDNKHAPFVVCGINEKQEPLMECGYQAYTSIDSPQHIIQTVMIKIIHLMG